MILISHRGNIDGKNIELENKPTYINDALKKGYNVEIDVWYKNGFYLGHDNPQYSVKPSFLFQDKIWCHAKNIEAIVEMNKYPEIHYFWHQEDDITLTSKRYIWVYPGKQPIENSIAVMPELYNDDISKCIGICSDNIKKYK
tara:strand:+ start:1306 stop:1731 length:426 start_codon:yes stop_codon:yes gene_type:complete